jgi:riboflavin synthase
MFTGIVEETGKIVARQSKGKEYSVRISAMKTLEGTKIGDSICVNGMCLTVTSINESSFGADISEESRRRTTVEKNFNIGSTVNLERAMQLHDRMHGHIVQGHIDTTTFIKKILKNTESWEITFHLDEIWTRFLVGKGSVAIDGVSLTISECDDRDFRVAVIPHTFRNTIFPHYREKDFVNLEFDILGKYVLNALRAMRTGSGIDIGTLSELGY